MGLFGFIKKKLLGKEKKADSKLEDQVIKEQEDLERLGKTQEEFMIPPNGLNR